MGGFLVAYPVWSFVTYRRARKRTVTFEPEEQLAQVYYKEGVFLIRGTKDLYALQARCTHLGCTLNHDQASDRFRCPCHGSVFDTAGKWLSGPAKKDLSRIPITRDGEDRITVSFEIE